MADMLVTASELASYLEKDVDTASATLAIQLATGLVQATVSQRLVQVADDVAVIDLDTHDLGHWLPLPEAPVTAVSTVVVGALPVTDYIVQLSRGRLWRAYGWRTSTVIPRWWAPSTVTVTYTHGYPAGDQRLQLARTAVLSLAKTAYENPNGATAESIDDYRVQYDAAAARLEIGDVLAAALRRQYARRVGVSVRLLSSRR